MTDRAAVRRLLGLLDADPDRPGLAGTPDRVVRFLTWFAQPDPFEWTTFDAEGADELVTQGGIPFYSLCEHHLVPFFGVATVGYIPDGRLVGLSKLARCVEWYARRLQTQERITTAVADAVEAALRPRGVGVQLRARHLCMEMRGPRVHDTWTTTTALRGALFEKAEARAEFLAAASRPIVW